MCSSLSFNNLSVGFARSAPRRVYLDEGATKQDCELRRPLWQMVQPLPRRKRRSLRGFIARPRKVDDGVRSLLPNAKKYVIISNVSHQRPHNTTSVRRGRAAQAFLTHRSQNHTFPSRREHEQYSEGMGISPPFCCRSLPRLQAVSPALTSTPVPLLVLSQRLP